MTIPIKCCLINFKTIQDPFRQIKPPPKQWYYPYFRSLKAKRNLCKVSSVKSKKWPTRLTSLDKKWNKWSIYCLKVENLKNNQSLKNRSQNKLFSTLDKVWKILTPKLLLKFYLGPIKSTTISFSLMNL